MRFRFRNLHELDFADLVQLLQGCYSVSLLLIWKLNFNVAYDTEIQMLSIYYGGSIYTWVTLTLLYVAAAGVVLFWNNKLFKAVFAITSVFLWIFSATTFFVMSFIVPAPAVFEIMLALAGILSLYYQGKRET